MLSLILKCIRTELQIARGGCVLCMDYGSYAGDTFVRLVRHFEPIVHVLTVALIQLEDMGFQMDKGYMFGFSFGGQLVTEAGRRIGPQRLKFVDSEYYIQFHRLNTNTYAVTFIFQLATWPVPDSIIAFRPTIDWPLRMYNVCTPVEIKVLVTIIVIKIGV